MKKAITIVLILGLIMGIMISCDKENNNNSFYVIDNDILTISLESNPTTGYQWEYTISNENVLSCEETKYEPISNDLCGSGGTWIGVFKSITDGTCTLTFNYKRSWEEEIINTESLSIEVIKGKITII